eukprot:scaffold122287_cov63-Phaeocystis_antarctica.AAC.1
MMKGAHILGMCEVGLDEKETGEMRRFARWDSGVNADVWARPGRHRRNTGLAILISREAPVRQEDEGGEEPRATPTGVRHACARGADAGGDIAWGPEGHGTATGSDLDGRPQHGLRAEEDELRGTPAAPGGLRHWQLCQAIEEAENEMDGGGMLMPGKTRACCASLGRFKGLY